MKVSDHNQKVLEKFAAMMVARMEDMKASEWKKGWIARTYGGGPVNVEGRSYSGGNAFMLMLDSSMNDYEWPIYCTLKQLNRLGCHVNKGARSMPVIFWDYQYIGPYDRKITPEQYRSLDSEAQKLYRLSGFLKSYNVFNIDQTNFFEKQPEKAAALTKLFNKPCEASDSKGMYENASIDSMLAAQSWICPIELSKTQNAFYSPGSDSITVPEKRRFKQGRKKADVFRDGMAFYATLLHEMVHSTGTPERLNRNTGKRFGDNLYAKEELVAELGAARVGQELGFDKRILDNNAAYLDGWISSLKQEPKFILSLMGDVDKASRMILEKLAA